MKWFSGEIGSYNNLLEQSGGHFPRDGERVFVYPDDKDN